MSVRGGSRDGILEAALAAARIGWNVIPLHSVVADLCTCGKDDCNSPGKHPRIGHGVNAATTDEIVIRRWWGEWPDSNVGVATGAASGIVVLDVDPRHCGDVSLQELEEAHGELPDTVESLTGGGGRHLIFCHPGQPVKNKVGILSGLDIRGDGGYIVAPPSRHVSGRSYVWECSHHPDDTPLASVPDWLLVLMNGRSNGSPPRPISVEEVIREGYRHDRLVSLAGSMRRRGMGGDSIYAALQTENASRCRPPLPDSEVRQIAETVSRYEPGEDFHLTDLGNARRLAREHGRDLRYCHPWGRWLVWDGTRWMIDETGEIARRAKATALNIYLEAVAATAEGARKGLAKHAARSESEARIKAMIALAASEPGMPIMPAELDSDPWVLNVRNGTVDLRTGELRPHRREDLCSKLAPVDYDPQAGCPIWEQFLARVMFDHEEVIGFLRRAIGYSLTGDVSEQVLFFLHGIGANGKSTLINAILETVGDYGKQAAPELLTAKRGETHPTEVADVAGCRLLASMEVEEGRRLAEVLVKQMTGGDRVKARFMHKDFFEFAPTHKIFLVANHKPIIRGTDHAIWRRIRLIPFDAVIPPEEQDRSLPGKLRSELVGILAWAVRGCLEWQERGLLAPAEVQAATENYRSEMDVLAGFLEDRCVIDPGREATAKELYEAYKTWCEANGEKAASKKGFGMRLAERGFTPTRGRERSWEGLELLAE